MKTTFWSITAAIIVIAGITLFVRNQRNNIEPTQQAEELVDVQYTLQTIADGGKMLYQGVGGEIDGLINPDLTIPQDAVVKIVLVNADGIPHNIFLPDFKAESAYVAKIGTQIEIVFESGTVQPGSYVYYCEAPGHRQAGQEGQVVVTRP